MKRIFIDTNILLDVFLERDPFCRPAQIVWSLAEKRRVRAAISAVSVSNIFYILERLSSEDKAYRAIETLTEIFKIQDVTSRIIGEALSFRHADFEDAIQYFCALKFRANVILSRDPKGFADSRIPVMNCSEYLVFPSASSSDPEAS